ncbi:MULTISPECIES: hypothetical protein [Empedobacter]|uniref:DUF1493 family protein n=1 Tax=Empedobacter falsenii TaxID=343874 RepID=A0A7H9DSV5_9FLAO|nr:MULTISPECIES: hypothetical protein [Empedobacter]MDH2206547.1 hypothetical protein [Empedobacter sp. GD03644]MDM1551318.1 hypothetical protein [Empedobacter falsenii]QLL58244.1 hypothetical protein FH779_09175 [Empedobacter falsenii]
MEEKQILYIDFATLRQSYIEVKKFLEKASYEKVDNSNILIEQDLGFCGDDTYFLIEEFVEKYNLDFSKFNFSEHFLSEGESANGFQVLFNMVLLPLYFLFWLVKEFTFDLINLNKYLIKIVKLFSINQRETLDMSFGDLLTSYLNKKYTLRSNVKFVLHY